MWPSVTCFLLGTVTPMMIERATPLVRGVIKRGRMLTNRLQKAVHEVGEDMQDLMAEASAMANARAERAAEGGTQEASSDFVWLRTSPDNGYARQKIVSRPEKDVVGS